MAKYLDKFPKLLYTKDSKTTLITNLLTRVSPIKGAIDSVSLFYQYDVQDGDTPEIVASKYYDDPELHWTILLFNDILDPYYDWPMEYQQFQSFIIDKYGSVESAKTTIHHYEKKVTTTDNLTGEITTKTYIIDSNTYNNDEKLIQEILDSPMSRTLSNGDVVVISVSKRQVDCYDYEEELNESKRKIKLIKKELIPNIINQFNQLMGE